MNGGVFQNMAPNARRSFVVTAVLGTVAAVLYLFCVQPGEAQLLRERRRLSDLQDRQARTNSDLKSSGTVKKDLDDLESALAPYRAAMLVPLLESYAMRAKSLLDPLALGAGLEEVGYSDEPFRALPLPKPMPRQLHTRAAVRVTAKGSYQQAVSFLLRLEREYPLVSLQRLDIAAVQGSPAAQSVTFVLEWPAKGGLTRK